MARRLAYPLPLELGRVNDCRKLGLGVAVRDDVEPIAIAQVPGDAVLVERQKHRAVGARDLRLRFERGLWPPNFWSTRVVGQMPNVPQFGIAHTQALP